MLARLGDIYTITSLVSFFFLAVSLWLGLYLVTRSPRSPIAWLSGTTLWAVSGYFLSNLMVINILRGQSALVGLHLSRWAIVPIPVLWLHLSTLYLPAAMQRKWRWALFLAYPAAGLLVLLGSTSNLLVSGVGDRPIIYLSRVQPGPLYWLFLFYMVVVALLSLRHFVVAYRKAVTLLAQQQILWLLLATLLSSLSGLYLSVGTWLHRDWLAAIGDTGLGLGVLALGYAVMRYRALLQGRTPGLDFAYALVTVTIVTIGYIAGTFVSYYVYKLPFIAFIFVLMLVVVTHSITDWGRTFFDRFFYRQQVRRLRANLRAFTRDVGSEPRLPDRLGLLLQTIFRFTETSQGFIALRETNGADRFVVEAAVPHDRVASTLEATDLIGDEIRDVLATAQLPPHLKNMAIIVPLDNGQTQIGVLVLGFKKDQQPFTQIDIDLLDEMADQIVSTITQMRQQEQLMGKIDRMVSDFQEREKALRHSFESLMQEPPGREDNSVPGIQQIARWVEDSLRHLYDYSYLGDHDLAKLKIVQQRFLSQQGGSRTHIEQGRIVKSLLTEAIDRLRPTGTMPDPPTKAWFFYVILHDAYIADELTRDIMSRLYISEATFHRARRRAIRNIAKVLREMELETQERVEKGPTAPPPILGAVQGDIEHPVWRIEHRA